MVGLRSAFQMVEWWKVRLAVIAGVFGLVAVRWWIPNAFFAAEGPPVLFQVLWVGLGTYSIVREWRARNAPREEVLDGNQEGDY